MIAHPDLLKTFNNLYSRNSPALKTFTQSYQGIDGLWVPETMGWDGNARGTTGSDYTKGCRSTRTIRTASPPTPTASSNTSACT